MMRERDNMIKVTPLGDIDSQVTSAVSEGAGNSWSAIRNNATNFWYVNMGNGNVSNNNGYNRYSVVPCPLPSAELLFSLLLEAEERCYANKHSSIVATRVHYHLSEIYYLAKRAKEEGMKPGRSECSVLSYPVMREIFCAQYYDRNFHHLCEPLMTYVSERIHEANGDVSFGNREGHSAFTAAQRIQQELRDLTEGWTKPAWVATRDYSGFFMSISRVMAVDMFRWYVAHSDYPQDGELVRYLTDLVCMYIMNDPTGDCIRKSPLSAWDKVADTKTLFKAKPLHGVPIGNLPSQIIANLFRAVIDYLIMAHHPMVRQVVFVDDRTTMSTDKEALKQAIDDAEEYGKRYGLTTNQRKRYMQPADHGVKTCGYVVKCDRIYISNRVVFACFRLTECYEKLTDVKSEETLLRSLNSYLGLMSHCNAYNIQKQIVTKVLCKHKTIYFRRKHNHFVCTQKKKYTHRYQSMVMIHHYIHDNRTLCRRSHHRHALRNTNSNI